MTRRTLGTVKVMMVLGAVAAAACSAPPASDGTVEARRSALEGDAGKPGGAGAGGSAGSGGTMGGAGTTGLSGRGAPPGRGGGPSGTGGGGGIPAVFLQISAPPSVYETQSSTIKGFLQATNPSQPINDVTVTITLTGSVALQPVFMGGGPSAPFVCTPPAVSPGAATVVCHTDTFVAFAQFVVPFTATAAGTITSSVTVTSGGGPLASDTRPITVLKADSADLYTYGYAPGSVFVGFPASVSFYVYNAGPLTATGVSRKLGM